MINLRDYGEGTIEFLMNAVGFAIGCVVALVAILAVLLIWAAPLLIPFMAVACGGRFMGWW